MKWTIGEKDGTTSEPMGTWDLICDDGFDFQDDSEIEKLFNLSVGGVAEYYEGNLKITRVE